MIQGISRRNEGDLFENGRRNREEKEFSEEPLTMSVKLKKPDDLSHLSLRQKTMK